jgi:hypothetical protein
VRALTVVAAAVLLGLGAATAHAQPRHLRVLFVGNSLTAKNDLPGTVAAFAHAVGHVTIDDGA